MAFSRFLCPCVHRDVRLFDEHGAVGRAHDAVAGGKLFKAVRAPARDAGRGEQRRVQILWDLQHTVDQAGIEVDVRAHGDRLVLARHDLLDAARFHALHQLQIMEPPLGSGQRRGVFFDDDGTRV